MSTLQGYFGSRDDMLIEALQDATSGEVEALAELAAGFEDPWQQLVALVDRGLSTSVPTWRMLMEFWTAAAHDAELRAHAAVLAEQYRQPFVEAVERGVEAGAWFFQNLVDGPLRALADAHDGALRLPTGDAAVSFIDTRDIAAVAVKALLGDHRGREYALTGPQSLTLTDVAEACRDSAIPVEEYQPVPEEDFRRAALDLGWHADYVNTLSGLFATIAAGHAAPVLPDTAEILGRPPRSLAEFVGGAR